MEVKIGVQYAPRELVLESGQTPDEVEKGRDRGDQRRRRPDPHRREGPQGHCPGDEGRYVEIAEATQRSVGFTGFTAR